MKRGRKVGWRKPERSVPITVRFSASSRAWLEQESKTTGLNMSELVRQLIEQQREGA